MGYSLHIGEACIDWAEDAVSIHCEAADYFEEHGQPEVAEDCRQFSTIEEPGR